MSGGQRLTCMPHRAADCIGCGPVSAPEVVPLGRIDQHPAIDTRMAEGGGDLFLSAAELRRYNGGRGYAGQAECRSACRLVTAFEGEHALHLQRPGDR